MNHKAGGWAFKYKRYMKKVLLTALVAFMVLPTMAQFEDSTASVTMEQQSVIYPSKTTRLKNAPRKLK